MLQARIAVFRSTKYASAASGDRLEVVERARGGFSIVMVDGQGSGRSAKTTSNLVATKAVQLLSEGARDGAVARAVHDFLYTAKGGKVSATLSIISVDLESQTLLVSRNGHTPVYLSSGAGLQVLGDEIQPIGVHRTMKPAITEISLEPGMRLLTFTDGVIDAGKRTGQRISTAEIERLFIDLPAGDAARDLFNLALERDQGRPTDDTTVFGLEFFTQPDDKKLYEMHLNFPVRG